jgi:hypothetical protein
MKPNLGKKNTPDILNPPLSTLSLLLVISPPLPREYNSTAVIEVLPFLRNRGVATVGTVRVPDDGALVQALIDGIVEDAAVPPILASCAGSVLQLGVGVAWRVRKC